jgi:hypothetical protein
METSAATERANSYRVQRLEPAVMILAQTRFAERELRLARAIRIRLAREGWWN